jgi:hypothetical protein
MGLFDKLLVDSPLYTNEYTALSGGLSRGDYLISSTNARSVQDALEQQRKSLAVAHAGIRDHLKPHHSFDPDNPAWSASVATLVDVWLAKFGDKWVEEKEVIADPFFSIVAARLTPLSRLEKHFIPDKLGTVYRIVE